MSLITKYQITTRIQLDYTVINVNSIISSDIIPLPRLIRDTSVSKCTANREPPITSWVMGVDSVKQPRDMRQYEVKTC